MPAEEPQLSGAVKAIQDVLLAEGSLAVKLSAECQSLEQFQEELKQWSDPDSFIIA